MIEPMYGGKTAAELASWIVNGRFTKAHDIVKNYWFGRFAANKDGNRELAWQKALHDGVITGSQSAEQVKVTADAKKLSAAIFAEPKASGGLEVGFYPSASTWDGRFANNGWLQETPDPLSKLTWGNAAMLSPKMARDQNLCIQVIFFKLFCTILRFKT